ncbi:hypothetical protein QBC40DRAFT_70959 [Triangularia verruculosa]|uniref:C2H2-type domain-containing protein n=1 Tax=Triangularia verruculosa TaxID=2587418 RepID=A0AAN6XJL1_9PEZI|nr:hypothetical protein QBC40DRAFT_70959 [Triangularia verruculosa]
MASQVDAAGVASTASHVCPHCKKSFARHCDLNKHAKSHSRPYKCLFTNCKYHEHGWPTAKELERHVNDKHSPSPRTFACLYQPCPYRSKRESNCKQHMEKAHKWKYVRSKSNGKRLPVTAQSDSIYYLKTDDATLGARNFGPSPISPQPQLVPPLGGDFVLYDDDGQQDAFGEDDDEAYSGFQDNQGFQTYLPWNSPNTRVRQAESVIDSYNGTLEKPIGTVFYSNGLLDPRLASYQTPPGSETHRTPDTPCLDAAASIKVESPTVTMDFFSPQKRKREPVDGSSQESKHAAGTARGISSSEASKPAVHRTATGSAKSVSNRRDSSDEDGHRPTKKARQMPVEDFSDTSMPDIFRFAHPTIYDRDQKETYSPCHTVHRDISTLVRHLSRPAHRFKVTDRFISSFDQDENFRHPRVGVCRWCWLTFTDQPEFETHVANTCEKVSKGKREKWRVLLNSFTPLVDQPSHTHSGFDLVRESEEDGWDQLSRGLEESPEVDSSACAPMASPALAYPTTHGDFVPLTEHQRLMREYQALQERYRRLRGHATQAMYAQQVSGSARNQSPDARDNMLLAAMSRESHKVENSAVTHQQHTLSDRDNLVQHMDSQSTDVDVQGFLEEVDSTHTGLTRQNSGFSTTSRSTIHHVPPSPPVKSLDYADGEQQDAAHGSGSQNPRKQPTSHADSGYATEGRRGSLAELGMSTVAGVATSAVMHHHSMTTTTTTTTTTDDTFMKDTFMSGGHEEQSQQAQSFMDEESLTGFPFTFETDLGFDFL